MKDQFAAILFNTATKEELYWSKIDEDKDNFYLLGYKTNKYGEISNVKVLPKFIWKVKKHA